MVMTNLASIRGGSCSGSLQQSWQGRRPGSIPDAGCPWRCPRRLLGEASRAGHGGLGEVDKKGRGMVAAGKKEGVARVEEEVAGAALWRGKGGEALVVVRGHAMCMLSSYGEENDRRTRWARAAKDMGRSWAGHFGLESSPFFFGFPFLSFLLF